jgi:hypothetical protein
VGRKRAHPPREGKGARSRRAHNIHDLTAGEAVNRLVSTREPACSRLFGPHAVVRSLKIYPGALSTGAAANEKQRPIGSLFSFHRRLPLPHRLALNTFGPGRKTVASAVAHQVRMPKPIEAPNKYKDPARPHKRQPVGPEILKCIGPAPAHGRTPEKLTPRPGRIGPSSGPEML